MSNIADLLVAIGLARRRPRDRFVLMHPHHDGPVLGYFRDSPIPAMVVDRSGRRYRYAGVMPCKTSGQYELNKLAPEEWIVSPGLVYRWSDEKKSASYWERARSVAKFFAMFHWRPFG